MPRVHATLSAPGEVVPIDELLTLMTSKAGEYGRSALAALVESELAAAHRATLEAYDEDLREWAGGTAAAGPEPWDAAAPSDAARTAARMRAAAVGNVGAPEPRTRAAVADHARAVSDWCDRLDGMIERAEAREPTRAQADAVHEMWDECKAVGSTVAAPLIERAAVMTAHNLRARQLMRNALVGLGASPRVAESACDLGAWAPDEWRRAMARIREDCAREVRLGEAASLRAPELADLADAIDWWCPATSPAR